MTEAKIVAERARQVLPLSGALLGDEYFYQSVPICFIDAVYSIGVRYSQVQKVVDRYCSYFKLQKTRADRYILPSPEAQESTSDFLKKMQDLSVEKFISDIFCNRQRTSTNGGILKAEAIYRFAEVLKSYSINYLQDVPAAIQNADLENDIKQIPGQRSGISLRYFFMLSGSEAFIKPDRMIQRFLESLLQRPIRIAESQRLLSEAVEELKIDYSKMTPRLLDNLIWQYQRQQKKDPLMTIGAI
ncbi:heme peroxidase [soil metagenome]